MTVQVIDHKSAHRNWLKLFRHHSTLFFGLMALVPLYATVFDQPFAISLFTRVGIFAIAALSLNFILGYGGMVSLGHAAYVGLGAYTVGILSYHGMTNGMVQLLVSTILCAGFALLSGAIALKTHGMYFIMITFAFAQMLFYAANGLSAYGGDDGLPIGSRSEFWGLLDLQNEVLLFYLSLASLVAVFWLFQRMTRSRFGRVIRGCHDNESRMLAMGFSTYWYKLVAFVIAGAIAGFAGALLANQTGFVSPAYMSWTRSGELMIMVVIGGVPSAFGPVIGSVIFQVLEKILASYTQHWQLFFGLALVGIVLFGRTRILNRSGDNSHD